MCSHSFLSQLARHPILAGGNAAKPLRRRKDRPSARASGLAALRTAASLSRWQSLCSRARPTMRRPAGGVPVDFRAQATAAQEARPAAPRTLAWAARRRPAVPQAAAARRERAARPARAGRGSMVVPARTGPLARAKGARVGRPAWRPVWLAQGLRPTGEVGPAPMAPADRQAMQARRATLARGSMRQATSSRTLSTSPATPPSKGPRAFAASIGPTPGTNFVNGNLELSGLSVATDTYATVQAKANEILTEFQSKLKTDSIRIPSTSRRFRERGGAPTKASSTLPSPKA
jgi:hypothetical protein